MGVMTLNITSLRTFETVPCVSADTNKQGTVSLLVRYFTDLALCAMRFTSYRWATTVPFKMKQVPIQLLEKAKNRRFGISLSASWQELPLGRMRKNRLLWGRCVQSKWIYQ
jgi:hypothetical protein